MLLFAQFLPLSVLLLTSLLSLAAPLPSVPSSNPDALARRSPLPSDEYDAYLQALQARGPTKEKLKKVVTKVKNALKPGRKPSTDIKKLETKTPEYKPAHRTESLTDDDIAKMSPKQREVASADLKQKIKEARERNQRAASADEKMLNTFPAYRDAKAKIAAEDKVKAAAASAH